MTRPAAVAGRFYPADPHTLAGLVDRLLLSVGSAPAGEPLAPAYVVPHAGLHYSGPTAAHVYARLRQHADQVRRVVLIGPAHYVPLVGCAVPTAEAWSTPLGQVPVDLAAALSVATAGYAVVDDDPHAQEHALEVQLPFLQQILAPDVPILPVAVGRSSVDDVAMVVSAGGAGEPGTVVLCSTDLSHYLAEPDARERDARTAEAVLALAPDRIGPRDACGVYSLRGLIGWARRAGLRPELLHLCTSAETAGDPTKVVGYSAFAFHAGPPNISHATDPG